MRDFKNAEEVNSQVRVTSAGMCGHVWGEKRLM